MNVTEDINNTYRPTATKIITPVTTTAVATITVDELLIEPGGSGGSNVGGGTEIVIPTVSKMDDTSADLFFQVSKSSLESDVGRRQGPAGYNHPTDDDEEEENEYIHNTDFIEEDEYDNNDTDDHDTQNTLVEDSWQYLGELPYRRITVYDRVQWGTTTDLSSANIASVWNTTAATSPPMTTRTSTGSSTSLIRINNNSSYYTKGLVCIPHTALPKPTTATSSSSSSIATRAFSNTNHPRSNNNKNAALLDATEYYQYVSTTTLTHVAVCPCGGPIATLTVPISNQHTRTNHSSSFPLQQSQQKGNHLYPQHSLAIIRIMTQSGKLLTSFSFPPKYTSATAADIFSIGFTSSYILLILLRDSTCFTYDIMGQAVLPSFTIFPQQSQSSLSSINQNNNNNNFEILHTYFYNQGVAVITVGMSCALIEILDIQVDQEYSKQSPRTVMTRRIDASTTATNSNHTTTTNSYHSNLFAHITILPTAAYAITNHFTYTTLAVLPKKYTTTHYPEIFLSTSDHSIVICDTYTGSIIDVDCRSSFTSPIVLMSFAPNGRFVACFSQNCILSVLSTSFETKVLDFDTSEGSSHPPRDMKWCGEDSVVLYWKNLGILMVGPYGDWLRFPMMTRQGMTTTTTTTTDYNVYLCSEVDSCRVITDESVEILQRIPPMTVQLLRIGSLVPGALLLDASDDFEKGTPSSDEAARAITKSEEMLVEAIHSCCQAAMCEWDTQMQKRLLTAASYGMHFTCRDVNWKDEIMGGDIDHDGHVVGRTTFHGKTMKPSSSAIEFVKTARKIRVMNALRDVSAGFAITSAQYDLITPSGIVARLIAMKRPAMATSICRYLRLSKFVHAACRTARASAFVCIDKDHTDADTAERAIKILNEGLEVDLFTGTEAVYLNRGCYAAVAIAAHKAERPGVANLLLIMELNVEDKVNALHQLGSFSDAAAVAVQAKDIDLIFISLMEYEKSCSSSYPEQSKAQSIFLSSVVSKFPTEAVNLLTHYYSYLDDVKFVMNALLKSQKFVSAGTVMAKKGLERSKDRDRVMLIQESSRIYGLGRDTGFQKTVSDEHLELLQEQEKLLASYADLGVKNASVSTTIYNILCYAGMRPKESSRFLAEADRLAKKFKVSEKRLWHLKIQAFGETDQWTALWSLGDSRTKPPISFKYFALEAIKRRQPEESIMKYIDKVTENEERYELLCEGKLWKRAVDEAMKLGDKGRLIHIRSVCGSPVIQQLCDELM